MQRLNGCARPRGLAPGWGRAGEVHVDPPLLLIVEVASPSTRAVDRGRKLNASAWVAPGPT